MILIPTDKFIDNTISIREFLPLRRDTITKIHLAILMMKMKTEAYPDKQAISLTLQQAYGVQASIQLTGYGETLMLEYRFQYIQDQFLQGALSADKILEIIDQFLFHTLMDEASFHECMNIYRSRMMAMRDDPDFLSSYKALELLDKQHSASISIHGYLEDLEFIDFQDVCQIVSWIHQQPKSVIACGRLAVPVQRYLEKIDETSPSINISNLYRASGFHSQTYIRHFPQTSFTKVWSTGTALCDQEAYAMSLMVRILGQCPENLLFETIREEKSLCYSIQASWIRFDGLLLVQGGIRFSDLNEVLALVDEQLNKIRKKEVPESVVESAKKEWIDSIRSISDRPRAWMEQIFMDTCLERSMTVAQRISRIRHLTLEEVSQVAYRLQECSLAIVKGDQDEDTES